MCYNKSMKQYLFWYRVGKRHRATYVVANTRTEAEGILKGDANKHGKVAADFVLDKVIDITSTENKK